VEEATVVEEIVDVVEDEAVGVIPPDLDTGSPRMASPSSSTIKAITC
jgi:hypothetical protein